MRPETYVFDDLGMLNNPSEAIRNQLRDVLIATDDTEYSNEPIVLDASEGSDANDDFMDRVIAMLTDLPVVLYLSTLIGESKDIEKALSAPLAKATLNLAGLRRFHGAFDGEYEWSSDDNGLLVEWKNQDELVRLFVPDPKEGTDFTLIARGRFGDFEWSSFVDLSGEF